MAMKATIQVYKNSKLQTLKSANLGMVLKIIMLESIMIKGSKDLIKMKRRSQMRKTVEPKYEQTC